VAPLPDNDAFVIRDQPGGWLVGRFPALTALPGIAHAVTSRHGPTFGPLAESPQTAAATAQLGLWLGLREIAWCRQVHGRSVLNVMAGGLAGPGDALVTDAVGVGLLCRSADCPLVLAVATDVRAVGIAHASWRATVGRVTACMIDELVGRFGAAPSQIIACICPSAGPCCYEVGPEVTEAVVAGLGEHARSFLIRRGERTVFDLWRANTDQLRRSGLQPRSIHVAGICTICRNDLFPSHRKEGAAAGRFAAVIAVAPEENGEPGEGEIA
jgi:hypothetical protein